MTVKTRVFMSGRSQALRLPAKLRVQAKEVRIEKIGDALWVQPEPSEQQNLAQWLESFYRANDVLPEGFLAERNDARPQERDWS